MIKHGHTQKLTDSTNLDLGHWTLKADGSKTGNIIYCHHFTATSKMKIATSKMSLN